MTGAPQQIDWVAVAPPLVLACAAVVVLLLDAFTPAARDPDRSRLPAVLTAGAVLGSAALAAGTLLGRSPRETFCVDGSGPASGPAPGPAACSFAVDELTLVFWGVVLFGTLVVALLGTQALPEARTPPGEWNFLLLCSATGAMVIAASRDLVTLLVALEVVSLPAFAMVGLRRGDRRAAEASVKFFLVSVVATAVTLMGVSLLYGATGSVFLTGVDSALGAAADAAAGAARDAAGGALSPPAAVVAVGTVLTVVGLAFKVAAVPFHMWVPDTYVGAPVAVAAYLSVVSKAAGFVGLVLVLAVGVPSVADVWSPLMAVLAALTMTVGNVVALWQQHAVRLLAWSSVAQAGYILVPFGALAAYSGEQITAVLSRSTGYLAAYAVINLGAFAVAAWVGYRRPAQRISDYRGLVRESPLAGWALAFALVGLAGLPPGILGLLAKVVVFSTAAGPATWLAVVMAVNVAIGLVYYARWLMELFRPAADTGDTGDTGVAGAVPRAVGAAVALTFAAGVALSVLPGLLLDPVLVSPLP